MSLREADSGKCVRATKQSHTIQGEHAQFAIASSPHRPFIAMTRADMSSIENSDNLYNRIMQKPFSARLLPFTFYLSAFTLLSSCWFNPNVQGKGEIYLQGEWQQDSIPNQKRLLEYSLHHLKFSCDSFYIQINSFSKVNNSADTCLHSGHWSEYLKGTYRQRNDTLFIKGQFCNSDYSLKEDAGCLRIGVYEEAFKVKKQTDSIIQFASTSNIIPINAHLVKHTACNPKPL